MSVGAPAEGVSWSEPSGERPEEALRSSTALTREEPRESRGIVKTTPLWTIPFF